MNRAVLDRPGLPFKLGLPPGQFLLPDAVVRFEGRPGRCVLFHRFDALYALDVNRARPNAVFAGIGDHEQVQGSMYARFHLGLR
ncbi:hypothetical protein D3C84_1132340 [compost metagenome]